MWIVLKLNLKWLLFLMPRNEKCDNERNEGFGPGCRIQASVDSPSNNVK